MGKQTEYNVANLTAGNTYFFALSAYDIYGNQSGLSEEISYTVPPQDPGDNHAPVAQDGSLTTMENTAKSGILNATDPDGNTLVYNIVSTPGLGQVSLDQDTGSFTYSPNGNANGTDSFSFKVTDGNLDSNVAKVTITIVSSNHPPVTADDVMSTNEDSAVTINVLANDSDLDGDAITLTSVGQASSGTVTRSGNNVVYMPHANFNGADTFSYAVTDAKGAIATGKVVITVKPVNDAPIAGAGNLTTVQTSLPLASSKPPTSTATH